MIREYIYFVDDNPNGTSGMTEEEIVRCKDCKHYKYTEGFKHGRYEAGYGCELGLRRVTVDDFCSYGEREGE